MSTNYDKLKKLLSELFQLDRAELDFGIYRIMNQKRDEIMQFLDSDLLPQVKEAFAHYQSADKAELQRELEKLIANIESAGMNPDQSPKVKELRSRIADAVDVTALENEVFSDLYSFFRRYYDKGDFISARRYKEGVYAIPYEGEEVKLYWANHDQYYIKTSEYFHNYSFKLPSGKRVCFFKLVEADVEKDNIKAEAGKERRFILSENEPLVESNNELVIRFEYKPDSKKRDQKSLNYEVVKTILEFDGFKEWRHEFAQLRPTEKNPNRTLLEQHLNDYTARNTFDYFIHKDLSKFLRRELDFFIKNEVMHLDDIEDESAPRVEQYLSKIKVIRKIAHKIIEFLAQIEDFQKKLWLKKKFVVETNYCVTLDRMPEVLYPDIIANAAQHDEWIKLFAINDIKGDLHSPAYSNPLTIKFLKANPFLVLDTKFFNQEFKDKLIGSFDNLDEQCDGLLIHSENFQALNLLQKRYKGQVKTIYIDPPYNTSASEIIYKNGYKSSSWLSYIENRLSIGKLLLDKCGMQCVTIDDFEFHKLRELVSITFGEENIAGVVAIKNNPSGRSTVKGFSIAHEYGIFAFASENSKIGMLPRTDEQLSQYGESDDSGKFQWRSFLRSGGANDIRSARPKLHYPLVVSGENISIPELQWDEHGKNWIVIDHIPDNHQIIYPISNGIEYTWRLGIDTLKKRLNDIRIRKSNNGKQIIEIKFYLDEEGILPKTIWDDKSVNATAYGTTFLRHIMGAVQIFSFPKSIYAVQQCLRVAGANDDDTFTLDYFAGSGTTGHAVINLNREDGGNRKYILVEMGNYFDTVLKPRIQKVIYSKDWKDGKPVSREGSSHMFKYICLESYEDTLNNIEIKRTDAQQSLLEQSASFRESYMLSYMLDVESRGSLLNVKAFEDPFNYKLNISTGSVGETKPVAVDLMETFNYLIGLTVKHIDNIRDIKVVEGTNPKGQKTLVLWRKVSEMDNDKLDVWFKKQKYNTKDMEYDLIYVNGDNNLENLRREDMTWKVRLIEEEFHSLMFDVQDV
jgi:adenine-specific DNA-methyltransferase